MAAGESSGDRPAGPGRVIIEEALAAGTGSLDEYQAKALFGAYQIPTTPGEVVTTPDDAVAAAARVGYPVVMKGASATIQHKTDAGLVVLDVQDAEAVRRTYALLEERGAGRLDGVLVERMVTGEREFVVGMVRDPLFGPVVMFGLGGIFTEVLHDVAFAITPVSRDDALDLLESIKARALLGPVRGQPAVDRDRLADIIRAVGQMAVDHPEIREIDINPLLVDGDLPVAVDALVALGETPAPATRASAEASHLRFAFAPRSVAVVGASADTSKWGGQVLANLLIGEFPGAIYPVNPKGGEILGLPVYPSVAELPETPDLVIVAVPAAAVEEVVEQCGRRLVPAMVVISAGFSEAGGEGIVAEKRIADKAARYGIALIGPNCMGIISTPDRLNAIGFIIADPNPGPAGFISQSGNLGVQLLSAAERRKGGIGKFVGVGNEALIDAVDFMDYLRQDPETRVILLYMEGFDDGRRLLEVSRRTTLEKPTVILRGGTSDYGKKAAASHTGAMASSTEIFDAAVRQSGLMVGTDPDEFLDVAFSLSYLPLPRGPRVAIVTMGGGWGVLASDEVARCGLELAVLPREVVDELSNVLPPFWSHSNPVDLVATTAGTVGEQVVEAVVKSDAVDAVVVLGVIGSLREAARALEVVKRLQECRDSGREAPECDEPAAVPADEVSARDEAFIRRTGELMEAHRKPVLNVSVRPLLRGVFPAGGRYSPVVLPSPLRAVRALGKMAGYAMYLEERGRAVR